MPTLATVTGALPTPAALAPVTAQVWLGQAQPLQDKGHKGWRVWTFIFLRPPGWMTDSLGGRSHALIFCKENTIMMTIKVAIFVGQEKLILLVSSTGSTCYLLVTALPC